MNKLETFISILIGTAIGIYIWDTLVKPSDIPSEPTKVCREGKLYEVTHEGNITIYDRKAFMTCEEK